MSDELLFLLRLITAVNGHLVSNMANPLRGEVIKLYKNVSSFARQCPLQARCVPFAAAVFDALFFCFSRLHPAPLSRPGVSPGSGLLPRAPKVRFHEEQRRDRPGENQAAAGQRRLCHQGAGGPLLPEKIPGHEEEVLRARAVKTDTDSE